MDKLQDRLLMADIAYTGVERVRHLLRFAPEMESPRYVTGYEDANGRWWVFTSQACRSKDEAEAIVGRPLRGPDHD